jgi:hypothetical protein
LVSRERRRWVEAVAMASMAVWKASSLAFGWLVEATDLADELE